MNDDNAASRSLLINVDSANPTVRSCMCVSENWVQNKTAVVHPCVHRSGGNRRKNGDNRPESSDAAAWTAGQAGWGQTAAPTAQGERQGDWGPEEQGCGSWHRSWEDGVKTKDTARNWHISWTSCTTSRRNYRTELNSTSERKEVIIVINITNLLPVDSIRLSHITWRRYDFVNVTACEFTLSTNLNVSELCDWTAWQAYTLEQKCIRQ